MEGKLPLMEVFYTIQGEGYHQGKAVVFIRLGGCDVGCPWCDIKESWDASDFPRVSPQEIAAETSKYPSSMVVVSGGEPLMYDLSQLTSELKTKGLKTHLETSGAYPLSGSWDWVCFSPKKFKKPVDGFGKFANELKVIIANKADFQWAEQFLKQVGDGCKKYLQPEWDRADNMMSGIIEYVQRKPEWEISLQIHKFMDIP